MIGHQNDIVVRTGEEACVSAEIRDGAVQSLVPRNLPRLTSKSDFELNSNIHLRHSCNQNMQNIVTWGQNMSANIEEFACISMGGLLVVSPFEEHSIGVVICKNMPF